MSLQDSGQYYHEVLKRIPPRDLPAFEDEAMQERVWGRRWGVYNDVGPIRTVLVHRPGDEIRIMTADRYDASIEALIDDEAQWYWRGDRAPDLAAMQKEHDALVEALRGEGAEVVHVGGSPTDPKAMFTRDNGVIVPGGAIICRMGPVGARPGMGRRGEEAHVSRVIAGLGMPVLRTIHGSGLFEGGSFALLNGTTAVAGLSFRQNEEAARQIEEVLAVLGIRLLRVPLAGHALHIDGQLVMVDEDLALINIERTPYWFLDVPLYVSPLYFVMNRARYDGLDPALRGAIDAASGPALAERFGAWWEAWAGPAREAVQRRGNTVSVLAPGERERWARAAWPALDRWLRALEADGVSEARAIYETAAAMAGAYASRALSRERERARQGRHGDRTQPAWC